MAREFEHETSKNPAGKSKSGNLIAKRLIGRVGPRYLCNVYT